MDAFKAGLHLRTDKYAPCPIGCVHCKAHPSASGAQARRDAGRKVATRRFARRVLRAELPSLLGD